MYLLILFGDFFELVLANKEFCIEIIFLSHEEEIIVDIASHGIGLIDCRARLGEFSLIGQNGLGLIDLRGD
jgi:hypothetical protein